MTGLPIKLCDDTWWTRVTSPRAYTGGRAVFAGLAAVMGVEALRESMRTFFVAHRLEAITTEELELHLAEHSGHPAEVRAIFHRFVYGREGPPPQG
jgi:hypothetical protein